MSKRFYLTTAIYYVNGQPHLGHAYEKIITDVIARARRALGEEVFFLTGLDEHGQKVQQAAQAEGKTPQAYCDELAVSWKSFGAKLGLTNDDFIRTTEARHQGVVQAILAKLYDPDRTVRAAGAAGLTEGLKGNIRLLTYILNTLVADHLSSRLAATRRGTLTALPFGSRLNGFPFRSE